ncbi:MAG: hypothetical protein OEM02_02780 [Desulfobulbaceae bacterium]|nr:hypothetical protein [Desulfobulbaceae bacterium]
MTDSQNQNKRRTQRRPKSGTNLSLIIVPAIILLLIIGGVWYLLYMSSSQTTTTDNEMVDVLPVVTPQVEPLESNHITPPGQQLLTDNKEKLTSISELPELPEDINNEPIIVPVPSPPIKEIIPKQPCELAKEKLQTFFSYLDQQHYIRSFELDNSTQTHFLTLAEKLLQTPPIVVRESDDLYTMLRNMAHFFRVIGKKNITIIKTILDKERDKIEDIAAELYIWSVTGKCKADKNDFPLHANVSQLYEYAGFFLNTMGGRSYLFRRDSRSRLLVNYYSILIIDLANTNGSNKHGINIDSSINQLIGEIEPSNQLIYKEAYLDKLYELLERYQP